MKSRIKGLVVSGLILLLVCSAACSPADVKTSDLTPMTLQLKWLHQAQFAGFYVAAEKGYYEEEGIDLIIKPGGVGINVVDEVVSGNADIGLIGAEHIIISRSQGLPLTAFATTYRNNPFVLVSMPNSDITLPEDLLGKTANINGIDGMIQVRAMFSKLGLDIEQVNIIDYDYDLAPFYAGEIDVTPAFAAGSLMPIKEQVPDVNLIWPIDYGIYLYADTLFADEEFIQNQSDLVLRFLRATLRGHVYALENTQEAAQISLSYADVKDLELQQNMIEASLPLIYTGEDEIGWMKNSVWQGMYHILSEQGLLEKEFNIKEAYTMQFLELIYGDSP